MLGARMGFDPAGLRRLEASLAPSPPLVDQTGAAPADAAAPAAPVQAPAASAPPWFSQADMFAPRLPDPSAYLAPLRTPLPTWETVAPPWTPTQQPIVEGRETGPPDLVRMLTGFGQAGIPTNFWNDNQGGAEPQWWPRGAPSFQSSDAPTDAQPTSAPVLPEQRDFKGWLPTWQSTNEGRETGPSAFWGRLLGPTEQPLILAAQKPRLPPPGPNAADPKNQTPVPQRNPPSQTPFPSPVDPRIIEYWRQRVPEWAHPLLDWLRPSQGELKQPPQQQPSQPGVGAGGGTGPEPIAPGSGPEAPLAPADRGFDPANLYDKLHRYLLDPEHPQNQGKGIWFQKTLGLDKHKWEDLASQLYFDESKAIFLRSTPHGDRYQQVIAITGPNGRTVDVPFVFQRDSTGQVTFITAIKLGRKK